MQSVSESESEGSSAETQPVVLTHVLVNGVATAATLTEQQQQPSHNAQEYRQLLHSNFGSLSSSVDESTSRRIGVSIQHPSTSQLASVQISSTMELSNEESNQP